MDETHVNTTAAINPRRPILLGLAQAKLELEKLRRSLPASDGVRVQCGRLQAVIQALQSLRGIDAGARRDLTPANQRARLLALLIAAHGVVGSAIWFRLHNSGSGSHFGSAPFRKLLQKWALLDMPRVGRDVHVGKAQEVSSGDFRYFQAIEF